MKNAKEMMRRLLYAAYNMSEDVHPETQRGIDMTNTAMKAVDALADLATSEANDAGVLIAASVFMELASVKGDVEAYVEEEERKGDTGERFQEEGAGISISVNTEVHDFNNKIVEDFGSHRADDRIAVLKLEEGKFYAGYIADTHMVSGNLFARKADAVRYARDLDNKRRRE